MLKEVRILIPSFGSGFAMYSALRELSVEKDREYLREEDL
jgi:hypothetical protein